MAPLPTTPSMRFHFSELCDLLGQRIDCESVLWIAERIGAKQPKPTSFSYSNSFGGMCHKPSGLAIEWSHEILAPGYYPPRKIGRRYVCWVHSIWFDPGSVDALPFDLLPDAHPEDLVEAAAQYINDDFPLWTAARLPRRPDITVMIPRKPGRWHIRLLQMQRYAMLSRDTKGNFQPVPIGRVEQPPERLDLATGFFVAWCALRGFLGERHTHDGAAMIDALQERQLSTMEYLYATCPEGELWSWDVCELLQNFTFCYFKGLCNRNSAYPHIGKLDRCHPDDDLEALLNYLSKMDKPDIGNEWMLFDRFSLLLDARWQDYLLTGLETKINAVQADRLSKLYEKMLGDLGG